MNQEDENTPEVPSTPTEASKGFMDNWGQEVLLGGKILLSSIYSVGVGLDLASGNTEYAVLHGITAGMLAAFAVVQYRYDKQIEQMDQKDQNK